TRAGLSMTSAGGALRPVATYSPAKTTTAARRRRESPRSMDSMIATLIELEVLDRRAAVSSRGQDTWFSATGPGFESPYRYQISLTLANSRELRRGLSPGKPRKEQHRIGSANLLATSFETFERSISDRASAVWID